MQPTSPQTQPAVPRPRVRSYGSPYPGPYAFDYPGPTRPYPDLPAGLGGAAASDVRMPRSAVAAGVAGVVGVFPLGLFSVAVLLLGWGASPVPSWAYVLPVAAVLELAGAMWLLGRRGWRFPALSFLPGTALFAVLLAGRLLHGQDLGLGWYSLALVLPAVALVLTLLPSVREWIRTRPRVRTAPAR